MGILRIGKKESLSIKCQFISIMSSIAGQNDIRT